MPRFIPILLLLAQIALGQPKLEFDAASVHPAAPSAPNEVFSMQGGPGSSDPGRINFRGQPLLSLLLFAFSLQPDRLTVSAKAQGPSDERSSAGGELGLAVLRASEHVPDWLLTTRFDIIATLPPQSSRDQFKQMLQNLLIARFGLTYHYARMDFPVYSLVIAKGGAKGGPKLKLSAVPPDAAVPRDDRPPRFVLDPDGFPTLPPGDAPASMSLTRGGITSVSVRGQTLVGLVRILQNGIGGGARVADKTGLNQLYDYQLRFASKPSASKPAASAPAPAQDPATDATEPEPVPDVFSALQDQLGLNLEKGSETFDVLIVDHIDRTPTPD